MFFTYQKDINRTSKSIPSRWFISTGNTSIWYDLFRCILEHQLDKRTNGNWIIKPFSFRIYSFNHHPLVATLSYRYINVDSQRWTCRRSFWLCFKMHTEFVESVYICCFMTRNALWYIINRDFKCEMRVRKRYVDLTLKPYNILWTTTQVKKTLITRKRNLIDSTKHCVILFFFC